MRTTPTTLSLTDDLTDQAGFDALLVDAALGRLRWLTTDMPTRGGTVASSGPW